MKIKFITLLVLLALTTNSFAQIDRSVQPKPGPPPTITIETPKEFTLKNGLKVMVVEDHKLPTVSASLILDNGPIYEGEKAGVMSILGGMLGNGTTSIPKDVFNEEIDYLGASLSINSQSANFNTLTKHFPRLLELMADASQNPLLTQDEFDKQQEQLIEGIKTGENSVSEVASLVQSALVYGTDHPYGEFITTESVENLKLEDAKKFYDTYFMPNNAYLIFIGDVDFKEVKKLVKKHFNDWNPQELPAYTMPTVENVANTEINFVDMPNAVQSDIAVYNTVNLKMGHPDYFPTRLANFIFGGNDGRLFMNLREDKGYTYGAYSRFGSNERTAATFRSSASVRNTVTDSAVVEFIKEIKDFRTTKVSPTELKDAKAAYVGTLLWLWRIRQQ